ncbi:hypothetical protein ACQB6R_03025 [Propionibacteriaceae bacterium G1746]|uniref:hypothetical protein n=1 Tax=Aestuariimicrobium sp. G57 TaxID=3418485 RepID=UPI003C18B68D
MGVALTGETLPPPTVDEPVAAWLAGHGWPADRLAAHRADCQQQKLPWPHQVPAELVDSWGQLHSMLQVLRAELGLDGLHPMVHQGPRVIGPAEQRLLAERPPHHGNV